MRHLFLVLVSLVGVYSTDKPTVTHEVKFDISHEGKAMGTIVIGVFGEVAPRTVQNFVDLASGTNGYGYKDSKIHRIIPDFMIQGGDFVSGDGTGSRSIYGQHFDDEAFTLQHYGPGWVSMANSGPNTNGCQFFITLTEASWLDGHHVVFGKVLQGMEIAERIAEMPTNTMDAPLEDIIITMSSAAEATNKVQVPLEGVPLTLDNEEEEEEEDGH